MKDVLKSALTYAGELFVMIIGLTLMLMWYVDN